MRTKKLFIFDLDGTLVDAYTAIWKSLNFTLKKLGYSPVGFREAKENVGTGDRFFIKTFFKAKDAEEALRIYRKHHEKSLKVYAKYKPYAKKALRFLKNHERKVAIASNRPRYFTNIILKALDMDKYFDYILCADQIASLKPKPKILNLIMEKFGVIKNDAVFIGDMDIDLETAKRARLDAIFVEGGSSSLEDVKRYRGKKVISSLRGVINVVKEE